MHAYFLICRMSSVRAWSSAHFTTFFQPHSFSSSLSSRSLMALSLPFRYANMGLVWHPLGWSVRTRLPDELGLGNDVRLRVMLLIARMVWRWRGILLRCHGMPKRLHRRNKGRRGQALPG